MVLLAAKLCRIKDAIPAEVFAQSVIVYPLLRTDYEQDALTLLGCKSEQVMDSRLYSVKANTCSLADCNSWCYPNMADVLSLKKHIENRVSVKQTNQTRIYISRAGAGRRRILNEPDLIRLLERYDFTIIEDVPRSITEQVSIYKNAQFILGPHGASFTNIIWCETGTRLVELFNPDYVQDYFLYLATILGLKYSAFCCKVSPRNREHALNADITVSIPELRKYLEHLLVTS